MAALSQSVKATYWLDDSKRVVGTTAEVSKLRSTGSSGPAIGNGSDTYATQGSTEGCEKSRRGSASLTTASSLMGLTKIVKPLAHEDQPGPISSSRSSRRGVLAVHVPCDVAGIQGHRRFESGSFRVVAMAAALESPDPCISGDFCHGTLRSTRSNSVIVVELGGHESRGCWGGGSRSPRRLCRG
ncbi:hypothetical protein CUAC110533_03465 [Cutibacterium acnes subsp. elongatum]|jgi:hypothetical protein